VKIENTFQVSAPPEQAWDLLMDVPRVIPCMPGAELTETVDESTWKATVKVKLGPIALTFNSDVRRVEADEQERHATLQAIANEARGRGSADATIQSWLTPLDGGTKVDIVTDLTLVGSVAQYGRGIVPDVASQLVSRFATCLEQQLAAEPEPSGVGGGPSAEGAEPDPEAKTKVQPLPPAPAKAVAGFRLGVRALASAFGRLVKRPFGQA
jgi:carbon monoxide dehydrogenase subunit G